MKGQSKLKFIKFVHTLIWVFFNLVIFYMLFAVITNKLGLWLWIGYGIIFVEAALLLFFRFSCPLTVVARKFSDSPRANFDICLPEWLARNNKSLYSTLLLVIIVMTIYRLLI